MAFYIIPFIGLVCFGVTTVYPAVRTFCLLSSRTVESSIRTMAAGERVAENADYVHWLMYWLIYSIYCFLESTVLFFLPEYFPMYLELKTAVFFWLGHEHFKGAGWVWYAIFERVYVPLDKMLTNLYEQHCPAAVKGWICGRPESKLGEYKNKAFEQARTVANAVNAESLKGK